ncbi:MAG: RsmG family class I SAM-dependent methyltransferase [Actinomycetota bacterium]
MDLGAGGGVPALPLLVDDPRLELVLVDASQKRMSFCAWAIAELGLGDRAEVWTGRAESFAHDPTRRGAYDIVVARGFGPPAITVECAAALLRTDGWCVISEPPERRPWPDEVPELGLVRRDGLDGVAVYVRVGAVEERFPRPSNLQKRAPLFAL